MLTRLYPGGLSRSYKSGGLKAWIGEEEEGIAKLASPMSGVLYFIRTGAEAISTAPD